MLREKVVPVALYKMNIIEYIKSLPYTKTSDFSIEIQDGAFTILISFSEKEKEITNHNDIVDNDIVGIVVRKKKHGKENIIPKLFSVLSCYYSITDKIANFKISLEENQVLFFDIIFSPEYIKFLTDFLASIKKAETVYGYPFNLNYNIKVENNRVKIIQSNTKTRRIGYLKLIITIFNEATYFPVNYLAKKIESDSDVYIDELLEYGKESAGDSRGLVKATASGISAKPYIDLLVELNLLTQVNQSYILTKQSKIYLKLSKKNDAGSGRLFKLNILDKLFFLRQLINSDSLYLLCILDIITIAGSISVQSIKQLFVSHVLNELDRSQQYSDDNSFKLKVIELKKRIQAWTKPIVYLEHIVEPRLNWLLDLGILIQEEGSKDKRYLLSGEGERLVKVFQSIDEVKRNRYLFLSSFITTNYFEVFNFIFGLNKQKKTLDQNKLEKYLLEAFQIFKTDAPNRIAASQAIDYVCFQSFLEDNIIIEFNVLKEILEEKNSMFSMDWFKTENDGALYIKRHQNGTI